MLFVTVREPDAVCVCNAAHDTDERCKVGARICADKVLSTGGLTYGLECAVRVRMEEKAALKFLLDFANEAGDIIDRIEATQRFSGYFSRNAVNL